MASTNHTTNYNLSQFLGTDKPAWLGDYNSDMSKIDAGINTAQTTATGADGKADTNATSIGTLANLTTEAKTSLVAAINEVDSHADTAQNTATSAAESATAAGSTANTALQGITDLTAYLNLVNFTHYTTTTNFAKTSGGGTIAGINLYVASNAAGTVAKVYGSITCNSVTNGQTGKISYSGDSGLRPSTDIDIFLAGIGFNDATGGTGNATLTIKTDGKFEIQGYQNGAGTYVWRMLPCLLFLKDFGDTPE